MKHIVIFYFIIVAIVLGCVLATDAYADTYKEYTGTWKTYKTTFFCKEWKSDSGIYWADCWAKGIPFLCATTYLEQEKPELFCRYRGK